ncbi:N-acetylmuramoyl-L-alanine amidase [Sporosarcina sp. OR05]|uniref:N-acetylmuramoyl-L-alanine amidase n=1 Tax=Sporosarcina sp. OR05 TaxID=2969819 RepID=UPI00352A154E
MSKVICIDPGHGGIDPGGGSNKHFKEKDMVLKISLEQKRHFERNGIKVVMTRTNDEYLDSIPRTNRVKTSGAKYCISNHLNAGGGEGAETIYSIHASSTIATGVLNALVAQGAKKRRVFNRRGTNGDWYYMHRMTGSVSTVIVEYGFADNSNDTDKVLNDWKRYAEAVAKYYIEHVFKQKYIPEKGGVQVANDKGPETLNLPQWQKSEMAKVYKLARGKGVFSSEEHEKNVLAGDMPIDQAIFLMTAIAGAALNGGKRVQ